MLRRILIGDNERVLVIRKRRFAEILEPGERWMFTLGNGIELEHHNVRELVYSGEWADYLANSHPELAARFFTVVETSDSQVAVVYLDGRLARVIGPSNRALFWKGPVHVTFDLVDVRENPEVPTLMLPALARLGRESAVTFASVEEGKRGLVYPRRAAGPRTWPRQLRLLERVIDAPHRGARNASPDGRSSRPGDPYQ
jgi:hypothetical protein